jgi:hypothetical protein
MSRFYILLFGIAAKTPLFAVRAAVNRLAVGEVPNVRGAGMPSNKRPVNNAIH